MTVELRAEPILVRGIGAKNPHCANSLCTFLACVARGSCSIASVTTTKHEVAVFEEEDGWQFILVWIDHEDVEAFEDEYTDDDWQTAIEEHPFIKERNLPVVIAFEDENGEPNLYGETKYVDAINDNFDWDNINWGYELTLEWDDDEDEEDEEDEDDD